MMKLVDTLLFAMVLTMLSAQAYAAAPVIGVLSATDQADDIPWKAFRQGLAEFGYVEGQNVRIEYRLSQGKLDRLPALAQELMQLKVSVIVAVTE